MPADYHSAAKALALPISPNPSPSPERQRSHSNPRPPWSRRLSNSSRRPYALNSRPVPLTTQILITGQSVYNNLQRAFLRLTPLQRVLVVIGLLVINVFGILFLIYNEKIFSAIAPVAKKWHSIPFGWTILWVVTFTCAFPPLIGYSTAVTISGFVYGFPNGWFIVASATVAGSLSSFVASRTVLSKYVHRLVGADKRFEALALTLKHDGLKILCMIRLCPLPYSISNAAMSTFPTVHPLSFALATAIASPKLLIHVFIGSRLAAVAENDGKMDAGTKAVNYASMILGGLLGTGIGWFIYQKTMARAKELEVEERERAGEEGRVRRGLDAEGRRYSDFEGDRAQDEDAAVLMDPDDISLWGNDEASLGNAAYRDEFTDDSDDDVFARGDGDNGKRRAK